jgi:hypothetical protein
LLRYIDPRLGVEVRSTWRLAERGPGRATVARSVFERLKASGFRELKVRLTAEACAHAFATAVPASSQHLLDMVGARGLEAEITS